MSPRSAYHLDLYAAFVVRAVIYLSFVVIVATFLGGCSPFSNPFSNAGETVKSAFSQTGSTTGTRNSIPQGGNYEKSDCAPNRSLDGRPET